MDKKRIIKKLLKNKLELLNLPSGSLMSIIPFLSIRRNKYEMQQKKSK